MPPAIINGRVLPVRAISESLGADVQWDGDKRTVVVVSSQTKNQFTKEQVINFVKPATVRVISELQEGTVQGSGFNID